MKITLLIIAFLGINTAIQAQSIAQYRNAIAKEIKNNNYAAAAQYLEIIYNADSVAVQRDTALLTDLAHFYNESNVPSKALFFLNKIPKNYTNFRIDYETIVALNRLEKIPKYTKDLHKKYVEFVTNIAYKDTKYAYQYKKIMNIAEAKAQNLNKEDSDWAIKHINNKLLNAEHADYIHQSMSNDVLIFSSNRYEWENKADQPITRTSGLYTFRKNALLDFLPSPNANTSYNNATYSLDNTELFFSECKYNKKTDDWKCSIVSIENKNGKWDKKNIKTYANLTNLEATFTQPNITFDSICKCEAMYFSSNKSGSVGGLDIFKTTKNLEKNWSDPININSVSDADNLPNTVYNEITPYYNSKINTLYFSSNGKIGIGNYDIFSMKINNGKFEKANFLPTPVNSTYDDFYFTPDTDTTFYLSSTRPTNLKIGTDGVCCADIYTVLHSVKPKKDTPPLAANPLKPNKPDLGPPSILTPPNSPPFNPPTNTTIPDKPNFNSLTNPLNPNKPNLLTNTTTTNYQTKLSAFTPIVLYFHNDEPDPDTRHTTTTTDYLQNYNTYINLKPLYLKKYIVPNGSYAIDNLFANSITQNYTKLTGFTTEVLNYLQTGGSIEIIIDGHCSPRSTSEYNINLSKRRISSIKNYYLHYQNGIFNSYINNQKLRFIDNPLGETTAPPDTPDRLNDEKGSIYSPAAALERRVQLNFRITE